MHNKEKLESRMTIFTLTEWLMKLEKKVGGTDKIMDNIFERRTQEVYIQLPTLNELDVMDAIRECEEIVKGK